MWLMTLPCLARGDTSALAVLVLPAWLGPPHTTEAKSCRKLAELVPPARLILPFSTKTVGHKPVKLGDILEMDTKMCDQIVKHLEAISWPDNQPRPYVQGGGFCIGATQDPRRAKVAAPYSPAQREANTFINKNVPADIIMN